MGKTKKIPTAFIWRRLHSLTGIWLVLFLIEHLLTNSQAALWIGDDGNGFVRGVNFIKSLPYLTAIEIFLLGVPILVHLIWGIVYLRTGQINSFPSDGATPSLTEYPRNHAYTWQRITSWILIFTLVGHVVHMRFIDYPSDAQLDGQRYYMVRVNLDEGLYTLAERLNIQLFDRNRIEKQKNSPDQIEKSLTYSAGFWSSFVDSFRGIFQKTPEGAVDIDIREKLLTAQQRQQQQAFLKALEKKPLSKGQAVAVVKDFGTAELLIVRETFKIPVMMVLYTVLVLAACFHGFNGLWTFFITWGINLTDKSQRIFIRFSTLLMILIAFLGLAAIWLTYWVNLKQ